MVELNYRTLVNRPRPARWLWRQAGVPRYDGLPMDVMFCTFSDMSDSRHNQMKGRCILVCHKLTLLEDTQPPRDCRT